MKNTHSMVEAIRKTGLTQDRILSIAEKARVSVSFGIPADLVKSILNEQETYISFRDFAAIPRGERYDGGYNSRRKLIDELERNDYFGVKVFDSEDLLSGSATDTVYFHRSDVPKLEENLASYFGLYALTEEEKIECLLNASNHTNTKACLCKYMVSHLGENPILPSFTEFVSLVLTLPDLPKIKDEDIQHILSLSMSAAAKDTVIRFLNYAKSHFQTKYSKLKKKKQESNPIPAYSNETYIALAKCIFNAEYIHDHKMIERALDNHFFIEMWLYLALHFCCGWRAGDICKGWRYLNLRENKENAYGINAETLYDDILYDRIPDEIYEQVCHFATKKIILSNQSPSKTAGSDAPPLVIAIEPTLATFFGLLTLISEAVMLRTGDGYMREKRTSEYQKKTLYKQFFGMEMYEILHGQNIQSRRLNKDYLQGIEATSRHVGYGSMMACAVASFARGHTNPDTIAHYLNDQTLNAENADMVLYFMLERGVFGFELYQTLVTAYPDAIKKLPMRKQNELMAVVSDTPYRIELEQSGLAAKMHIKDRFDNGDNEMVVDILRSMFEITQGRAKAKDEGIHCLCRARGNPCAFPEYDSCLANTCPHLVFTQYGYKALLEIIRDYKMGADAGDVKKAAVLEKVIMPRFRDIINALLRRVKMEQEDKNGLRLMLEEALQ